MNENDIIKTKKFIKNAKKIHGNKYNYSLVNYVNACLKIRIICSIHGIFEQSPGNHLQGKGCSKCSKRYKMTKEEFIKKANIIHGEFEQYAKVHLNGHGCSRCSGYKKLKIEIIENFKKIHKNHYNYDLCEYKNNRTKIKIKCNKCDNIFTQTPTSHLSGKGCPYCYGTKKYSTSEYIIKAKKIHNDKYDYSFSKYDGSHKNITIICKKHGKFITDSSNHINKNTGCPICNESKGEKEISKILDKNNIKYIRQKKFKNCKYINQLLFDFYLLDYNLCVEFDGKQHFEAIQYFGDEKGLKNTQKRDKIKNKYCFDNNIKLLRIKYNEKIGDKLKEII